MIDAMIYDKVVLNWIIVDLYQFEKQTKHGLGWTVKVLSKGIISYEGSFTIYFFQGDSH